MSLMQAKERGPAGALEALAAQQQNDPDAARTPILSGICMQVKARFPDLSGALSELIRTKFVAGESRYFIVAGHAAIAARIIA